MIRRSGHLRMTGPASARAVPVADCPALRQGVVFTADNNTGLASRIAAETAGLVPTDSSILWNSGSSLHALHFNQRGETLRPAVFSFGNLAVHIPAGAIVRFDDESDMYRIAGSQVTVGTADPASHRHPEGDLEIAAAGRVNAGDIWLRVAYPFAQVAPSVRYFYAPSPGAVAGFQYPLLHAPSSEQVMVNLQFDMVHPLDTAHNRATFSSSRSGPSGFFTVDGRRLHLKVIAGKSGTTNQWDPVTQNIYPAPLGDWGISTGPSGPSGPINLMCGLSGLEFAQVSEGSVLRFVPGAPAFAPKFPEISGEATASLIADCPGSEFPVTTSWAYIVGNKPNDVPGYFSQPVTGGLFEIAQQSSFLNVLQMQSASLPPDAHPVFDAPQASFPMAPYGDVGPATAEAAAMYRRFEIELLSTVRSNAIFDMNWSRRASALPGPQGVAGAEAHNAVTPQGMVSVFSPDLRTWDKLTLASTGHGSVTLELQDLGQRLRAALLTPQLFLVISDSAAFEEACKVFFPSLVISGWTFNCGPKTWRDDTVLMIKFADKSLAELIDDRSLWSTAGAGLNHGAATQTILKNWIAEAETRKNEQEFDYFRNTVLHDWNGVLFANVTTPADEFPSELRALAAGLDISRLKAHHLGINLSPFDISKGVGGMSDSSFFGLIDYQDVQDLVYSGDPYDFKVLSLRVLFANSEVSSFSSQVELLVGQLFAERSTLRGSTHGDNLILDGVMERHGDEQSYNFTMQGKDAFTLSSQVVESVTITKAQFVTLPQTSANSAITARFLMWGSLRFLDHPEFDLFSFGPTEKDPVAGGPSSIQFSNMFVSMTYTPDASSRSAGADPRKRVFAFEAGQMVFDLASSFARPLSLYAHFPVQLTGMVQGDSSSTPASLGFLEVDTPLTGGSLGSIWFALRMSLSLGSQGGLAAQAGFNASLLAVWAPSSAEPNALLAVQLPGSETGGRTMSIEGPLKLTTGSVSMLFNPADTAWIMRLNSIALSIFGLKFPPGGKTNLLLFGDPDAKAKSTTLGWYAAYEKDAAKDDKPKLGKLNLGRLKTGRAKALTARRQRVLAATSAGCGCPGEKPSEGGE